MDTVNSSSTDQVTELYVKKVLPGDIDDVRARLVASMESLGYDIIEEEPNLIGRRGSKGWATWFGSADVLEYATTLTVRLKQVSESSTRATFDYLIKHPMLNKGEKAIVVQEAKTITALSKAHAIEKMCSVCETESTDDSRFCRNCGAPLTSEQAELEVLRLMAEVRAGKTAVVASSLISSISAVVLIIVFLIFSAGMMDAKLYPILMALGSLGVLAGIACSFFGWNRMRRALKSPETAVPNLPRYVPAAIETPEQQALPPRRVPASVTEGTTNLLDEEIVNRREKEKIPLGRGRDTNDL